MSLVRYQLLPQFGGSSLRLTKLLALYVEMVSLYDNNEVETEQIKVQRTMLAFSFYFILVTSQVNI